MSNINNDSRTLDPVAGKTVSEIFGEIVWIASQDYEGRSLSIADLEWLVMPPILLRQFHITYAENASGNGYGPSEAQLRPIKVEIFALMSLKDADALRANPQMIIPMKAWGSGKEKITVRTFVAGRLA